MTNINENHINPLINVEIHLYFEVNNSELTGGKGSVGYTTLCFEECSRTDLSDLNNGFIESQIENMAGLCGVDKKYVRAISKEEYDEKSNDEND